MRVILISAVVATGLTACASSKQIPVEQAMAQCRDGVHHTVKPNISIGVGVGGGGKVRGGLGVGLSTDQVRRPNSQEEYENCVIAKSGEKPTRPLYE